MRMELRKAVVEPFPLVPAMWTYRRSFWGSPSRDSRRRMASSLKGSSPGASFRGTNWVCELMKSRVSW